MKTGKPVIGVLTLIDYEKDSYWMVPGYMQGIQAAGGLPFMLPFTESPVDIRQLAGLCDGFLFTGGHDVSPELYGAQRSPQCAETSPERDALETLLFREAYALDKPILGICRGIQFVNAVMGGTLWQDLPTERPSKIEHHQAWPYDVPQHRVAVLQGSPLCGWIEDLLEKNTDPADGDVEIFAGAQAPVSAGKNAAGNRNPVRGNARQVDLDAFAGWLAVNSYHHQAVKTLAAGLSVMAISEDGLVEAVCDNTRKFLWAVQWHPEFVYQTDESSRRIFRAFVEACRD